MKRDTKRMHHPYRIAACLFTAVGGACIGFYRLNYRMPLKVYTANALYMGVLDDAICRQELGDVVEFPSKRETLQYRYHLFLVRNRRKSRKKLENEIRSMEHRLNHWDSGKKEEKGIERSIFV